MLVMLGSIKPERLQQHYWVLRGEFYISLCGGYRTRNFWPKGHQDYICPHCEDMKRKQNAEANNG